MNSRCMVIGAATAALVVGFLLGTIVMDQPVVAQPRQNFGNGRFQISAYADTVGDSVHHGCYVLDTSTGQVYHALLGGNAEKVADRLP
ncbi:MAG: hypothetical protein HY000_03430 [Planctomycetes bacterium]|nr:hypothetical protein [Planctomycetota bacterium]